MNQEHYLGLDAAQNHQKVAALLTLGKMLVSKIIPTGILDCKETGERHRRHGSPI